MSSNLSIPYYNYGYSGTSMPSCNTVPQVVTAPMGNQGYYNEPEEDTFMSAMGGAPLMAAIEGRGVIAHPFQSFRAAKEAQQTFRTLSRLKNVKALNSTQIAEAYNTLYRTGRYTDAVLGAGRTGKEVATLRHYITDTQRAYKAALKSGNTAKAAQEAAKLAHVMDNGRKSILPWKKVVSARDLISGANAAGKEASTAARAARTVTRGARTASAATKATGAAAEAATAVTTKGLWKGFKAGGGPVMFAIEALCEAPEVYTAFSEGGFSEGMVQTGKSAVKAGASAAGWVGGAALGGKAGAAIGTAICPGIGTAIGAAIGSIIGGFGGSWLGTKTAKAVTGKSFTEKQAMRQQMQPQMPTQMQGANPFGTPQMGGANEINLSGINFNSPNPYLRDLILYQNAMAR